MDTFRMNQLLTENRVHPPAPIWRDENDKKVCVARVKFTHDDRAYEPGDSVGELPAEVAKKLLFEHKVEIVKGGTCDKIRVGKYSVPGFKPWASAENEFNKKDSFTDTLVLVRLLANRQVVPGIYPADMPDTFFLPWESVKALGFVFVEDDSFLRSGACLEICSDQAGGPGA